MPRLSQADWLAEGFKVLSEFAQDKLRILYLCERLGVSRGSFYHHFESIDDYIERLMQSWETQHTQALIEAADQNTAATDRMNALNDAVMNIDQAIEAAIRSWAFYHPIVQNHLQIVDQLRLQYLETLYLQMGFGADNALQMARLEYATLIGVQQLFPRISATEMEQMYRLHAQAYRSLKPE